MLQYWTKQNLISKTLSTNRNLFLRKHQSTIITIQWKYVFSGIGHIVLKWVISKFPCAFLGGPPAHFIKRPWLLLNPLKEDTIHFPITPDFFSLCSWFSGLIYFSHLNKLVSEGRDSCIPLFLSLYNPSTFSPLPPLQKYTFNETISLFPSFYRLFYIYPSTNPKVIYYH